MQFAHNGSYLVARLDEGEEAIATLRRFLTEQSIFGGYFAAWGAFSRVKLRYYRATEHEYYDRVLDRQVEVVSLLGNIACLDDEPIIHAHMTVGDEQFQTYSGHLAEGTVRPTLEVFVTPFPDELRRRWDTRLNLALLDLKAEKAPAPVYNGFEERMRPREE